MIENLHMHYTNFASMDIPTDMDFSLSYDPDSRLPCPASGLETDEVFLQKAVLVECLAEGMAFGTCRRLFRFCLDVSWSNDGIRTFES